MAQTTCLVLFGPIVVVRTLVMVVVGGHDAVVDACGRGCVEMVVVVVLLLPSSLLLLPLLLLWLPLSMLLLLLLLWWWWWLAESSQSKFLFVK